MLRSPARPLDAVTPVQVIPLRVRAAPDAHLAGWRYRPAAPARAVLLISGAMAVAQRFYAPLAGYLARHGFEVLTYDYRDFGASRTTWSHRASATAWDWAARDHGAMLERAFELADGRPVLAMGHSFGGQVLPVPPRADELAGAVTVAAQRGYWHAWSGAAAARMAVHAFVSMPLLTRLLGKLPGWAGLREDLPAGVAREWASWIRDPDYLLGRRPEARRRYAAFDRPVLGISAAGDDYAADGSVDWLLAHLGSSPAGRIERWHIGDEAGAPLGHFGFFRPERAAQLWPRLVAWLGDTAARHARRAASDGGRPPVARDRHFARHVEEIADEIAAGWH